MSKLMCGKGQVCGSLSGIAINIGLRWASVLLLLFLSGCGRVLPVRAPKDGSWRGHIACYAGRGNIGVKLDGGGDCGTTRIVFGDNKSKTDSNTTLSSDSLARLYAEMRRLIYNYEIKPASLNTPDGEGVKKSIVISLKIGEGYSNSVSLSAAEVFDSFADSELCEVFATLTELGIVSAEEVRLLSDDRSGVLNLEEADIEVMTE